MSDTTARPASRTASQIALVQGRNKPDRLLKVQPGVPLWKLAPTRDEEGVRLCDFMVLIPRLKSRNALYISEVQAHVAAVLRRHKEVVFANMDLNLNVLWVSHRYRRGLMLEIIHAIRLAVPEAVLVAQTAPA